MRRLYKSSHDRRIMGVCGGLADYFGIDATVIRLLTIVAMFYFGVGFLPYIILGIILPMDYTVGARQREKNNPWDQKNRVDYIYTNKQTENPWGDTRKDVTPKDDWSDF